MLNVLIVDDSLIMRRQLIRIVGSLGHKVVASAKNNEEAISAHSKFKIDLVTMDITMPGIDGVSTTKEILNKDSSVKIIMITSHGQEDMVVDSLKAGASGYLLKPVTDISLSDAIKKVYPNGRS